MLLLQAEGRPMTHFLPLLSGRNFAVAEKEKPSSTAGFRHGRVWPAALPACCLCRWVLVHFGGFAGQAEGRGREGLLGLCSDAAKPSEK